MFLCLSLVLINETEKPDTAGFMNMSNEVSQYRQPAAFIFRVPKLNDARPPLYPFKGTGFLPRPKICVHPHLSAVNGFVPQKIKKGPDGEPPDPFSFN
jgi:hypothetical protein